ncbi:RHS repeat domain-containing protein [Rugamonas sp. CCM 8940]|uniref:RHS repeat domain-containing protein n=2 Tax=Rugamonas sp. CCM 8940 TaxID=2765359 RepID=UPI00361B1E63
MPGGKVTQEWIYPLPATAQSRVLSATTYDANGRFPATATNALGHQERHRYDAGSGARLERVGPNGLATQWEVDGLGRVSRELRADGNESRYYQKSCTADCPPATATALVRIVESFHGKSRIAPPSVVYLDDAGRTLRKQSWGADGRVVVTDQRYDTLLRLAETDRPRFLDEAAYLDNRVEYDELNRVTRVVKRAAGGAEQESRSDYDGLRTVLTNARKYQRVESRDVLGQLRQADDAKGKSTSFGYDPFGNLATTTDPNGNIIKVGYDLLGRRTSLDDPDLGLIGYEVDPLGQTRVSVSPRQRKAGQRSNVEYDALGRMTARNEPDLDSYWIYDTAPMGVGQLAEANTVVAGQYDYRRQHTYDSLGRPSGTTTRLRDGVYASRTEYDAWGRPSRQVHQRGDDAAKAYDLRYGAYGQLSRVERAGLVLWELGKQDAAGRETEASWGNGLVRKHDYSPYTGQLDGGALQTAAGGALLQEGYQYDALGNVTDRTHHWSEIGYAEHFVYDELNRLKSSEMLTPARAKQVFDYDAAGNLTGKPGVGDGVLRYPAQGKGAKRPHAVDSIGGLGRFEYDDNGNLTGGAGRTASWTSFDMPVRLSKGDKYADFVYGPEHQRTRQERQGGGSVVYAGAQEVENVGGVATVKTYWPLGLGVEIDRPGQETALHWIYRDHLGSPIAMLGAGGERLDALDYDAWGKRREVGDDAPPDELVGKVDNRGYTGHEMLDQLDLVHMNGRVYDPALARFLSADPHLTDPGNGQSFNRYSYVLNNPTNLVDPTGYDSAIVEVSGCGPTCEARRIRTVLDALAQQARQAGRYLVKNPGAVAARVGTQILTRTAAGVAVLMPGNAGTMDHAGEIADWQQQSKNGKPLFSPEQIEALRKDAEEAQSENGTNSAPPVPGDLVGDQSDPRAGPGNSGKRHTSGPLTPGNGGTGDAEKDFDKLTGGTGKPFPGSDGRSKIPGAQVGDNGVWIRPGTKNPGDGPRIEIPGNGNKLPETLHY